MLRCGSGGGGFIRIRSRSSSQVCGLNSSSVCDRTHLSTSVRGKASRSSRLAFSPIWMSLPGGSCRAGVVWVGSAWGFFKVPPLRGDGVPTTGPAQEEQLRRGHHPAVNGTEGLGGGLGGLGGRTRIGSARIRLGLPTTTGTAVVDVTGMGMAVAVAVRVVVTVVTVVTEVAR